jgi:peptidoglycan/LPS O-acetylase OafA/YrhL
MNFLPTFNNAASVPAIGEPSTKRTYLLFVDGLRSVAVLSVICYHLGFSFMPGGYVGVDVFFVISGFLIVGI